MIDKILSWLYHEFRNGYTKLNIILLGRALQMSLKAQDLFSETSFCMSKMPPLWTTRCEGLGAHYWIGRDTRTIQVQAELENPCREWGSISRAEHDATYSAF
jgi:hypothetical protein